MSNGWHMEDVSLSQWASPCQGTSYHQAPEFHVQRHTPRYPAQQGFIHSPTPMVSISVYRRHMSNLTAYLLFLLFTHLSPSAHEEMHAQAFQQQPEDVVEQIVTVSTYFHPTKFLPLESDLVLRSSDGIHFYVHQEKLTEASEALVPALLCFLSPDGNDTAVSLPEAGQILNILLHAIYGTSCAQNRPTCDELVEAMDAMPRYGLVPKDMIRANSELYNLLLMHAPLRPLDIYALAGHYDVEELAKVVSSHLLSLPLNRVSDTMAVRMGPVYLRRLFSLHISRMDSLKNVLSQPPQFHRLTRECSFEDQKRVSRAWALGATYLVWELRADISPCIIRNVFEPLAKDLDCADCKEKMTLRLKDVLTDWAGVKSTI
ncbi:hypothetical protein NMY22_g7151 [Coprinellus aureogranulatus]|nr:hypothetical protein NMY22_g7151 [Coprinellus aureogranulatus]